MPAQTISDADVFRDLVHASLAGAGGKPAQELAPCASVASKYIRKRFGGLDAFLENRTTHAAETRRDGFTRLEKLRQALVALDRGGWERSYHQRLFHESFINAIVRILFKTDPPGFFSQSYPRLLELNGWTSINQEILVSTPRRFGKTISVCLFVAALMYACPNIEISIYSTCKRISQKLLRNCMRFLDIVHTVLGEEMPSFLKQTSDEVEIQGGEGKSDYRRLNSYPSKVLPVCGRAACVFGVFALFLYCLSCLFCLSFALWHAMQNFPGELPGEGGSPRMPSHHPTRI